MLDIYQNSIISSLKNQLKFDQKINTSNKHGLHTKIKIFNYIYNLPKKIQLLNYINILPKQFLLLNYIKFTKILPAKETNNNVKIHKQFRTVAIKNSKFEIQRYCVPNYQVIYAIPAKVKITMLKYINNFGLLQLRTQNLNIHIALFLSQYFLTKQKSYVVIALTQINVPTQCKPKYFFLSLFPQNNSNNNQCTF
eukprot:TRINITY_DN4652_c1_g1_i12.p4 TRINITY_DN4652_c1_g1~~TRINITY_DN4652_c1_g1_i12.p4  ORF type:complete len:195 (+),score=-14.71 TRINITY_DN4652_c1_g1_i12:998-1582(+)